MGRKRSSVGENLSAVLKNQPGQLSKNLSLPFDKIKEGKIEKTYRRSRQQYCKTKIVFK